MDHPISICGFRGSGATTRFSIIVYSRLSRQLIGGRCGGFISQGGNSSKEFPIIVFGLSIVAALSVVALCKCCRVHESRG